MSVIGEKSLRRRKERKEERERAREAIEEHGRKRKYGEGKAAREEEVEKKVEEEKEAITSFVESACALAFRTFGPSTSTAAAPVRRSDDVNARVAMSPRLSSCE